MSPNGVTYVSVPDSTPKAVEPMGLKLFVFDTHSEQVRIHVRVSTITIR